jgi:hypothetical protein
VRPVEKCPCGAECDWCIAANRARSAFPRATVPPKHDADTEHQCLPCFDLRAIRAMQEPPK